MPEVDIAVQRAHLLAGLSAGSENNQAAPLGEGERARRLIQARI
jgi:hypothetical protein